MPETELTVQNLDTLNKTVTFASVDVANGNIFTVDGNTMLWIEEGNGSGTGTVTFTTPATVDGLAVADPTVTVTNGEFVYGKRLPIVPYANANNKCVINFTGANAADINVAVVRAR